MSTQLPKSMHWVFNQCDDAVKYETQAYWKKKWPRLAKLLKTFPLEVQDVRLIVTCHRPTSLKPWYDLHAVLKLPIGIVVADASGKEPAALIDHAVDILVAEAKRRKERGSKSFVYRRKNRSHADLSAAGPRSPRSFGRRQEFFAVFRPLLPRLGEHARHELRALEGRHLLHRGELTVADLLDEVLTRAWQKFEVRPRGVHLETWFKELMHNAIEEWIKQEPHPYRSVDQPVREELPTDEQPQIDDQEWWEWLLGYREASTVADLLPARENFDSDTETTSEESAPGRRVSEAGDDVSEAGGASEKRAPAGAAAEPPAALDDPQNVWLYLRELPKLERQALIFQALDGLSPREIALLQDRPESAIRSDIEAAEKTLRERLLADTAAKAGAPTTAMSTTPAPDTGKPVAAAVAP